jgi:hypothetical protein
MYTDEYHKTTKQNEVQNNVELVHKRDFRKPENMSFIISVPLDAGLNYMHIHCSFITEYEMKLSFVCNDLLFILSMLSSSWSALH